MLECNQSAKDIVGYKWTLSDLKGLSTDNLWTWLNTDGVGYDGDTYLELDKCVEF